MKRLLTMALALVAAAGLGWLVLSPVATASDNDADATVKTKGDNGVKINKIIFSTLRFGPEDIKVNSGDTLAFKHNDKTVEPHSASVVNEADLPQTFDEVFACGEPGGPCEQFGAHFPDSGPPVPVLNQGAEGFDVPGDSLFFEHGQTVTTVVSALPGTELHYLCLIHPWMQGTIEVRGGNGDGVGDGDDD